MARHQFSDLLEEPQNLQDRIKQVDNQIKTLVTKLPSCQRLLSMTGIGPLIATALYAGIGNGQAFKSGRH